MKDYELTTLKREVAEEMAQLNPGITADLMLDAMKTTGKFHYYALKNHPPLVDISPLARLTGLSKVLIYNCNVRDISPLSEITALQELHLHMKTDTLPCDFTALKELNILLMEAPHCGALNLRGLPNLERIYLHKTDSLEGISDLPALTQLHIEENTDLCDISPLATCTVLEQLSAWKTAIQDLTPLAGHPSLRDINLNSTKVTDVSPLADIPTLERVWLYGTAVEDVSCLASLPRLNDLNLRKTQVVDLSAFKGREHILGIERKKLGLKKAGKSAEEIKTAIEEIRERLEKLGVTPGPPLKRTDITAFQEKTGVKLPKEYAAFLTQIGDGFQVKLDSFLYKFPPLAEVIYDPEGIKKRFSHREAWVWEDDDSATGRKIAAATTNGQIELVDRGCGQSYRLIVCGGAKGEVWDVADVGIAPYGNGLDFLDWLRYFLDGTAPK